MSIDGTKEAAGPQESVTMKDLPEVSVVIVTYKSKDYLPACIRSVYQASEGISLEIIIVDNASGEDLTDFLHGDFPEIKVVENRRNEGFARGVNQGVSLASGRFLAILNPDVYKRKEKG